MFINYFLGLIKVNHMTFKEIVDNNLIVEETPNSLLKYIKRTIFNKPVINKQSDFSALGGNAINQRISSAKKYNDIQLKNDNGKIFQRQSF